VTARCSATYERSGGRAPGARLVECHLQVGHPGEHEEDGTDVTWIDEPHLCVYSERGFCTLPGLHGGVPDPDPADADVNDFEVVPERDDDPSLRCAHYARGCWWEVEVADGKLGVLLAEAREHLAADHRRVIDVEAGAR